MSRILTTQESLPKAPAPKKSLGFRLGNCGVHFREEARRINELFCRGTEEQKIAFARGLVHVWCDLDKEEPETVTEATETFGEIHPDMGRGSARTMVTVDVDGTLRMFFGLPCSFKATHVESNGKNCIIEAYGERADLDRVARALLGGNSRSFYVEEVTLSNGVTLYLRGER